MGLAEIRDDAFILKIRDLFRYIYGCDLEFALTPDGVCNDAFFIRTINYNTCVAPWIESAFPLKGRAVVEIGCGSGAATLAMAEKCAHIDSFDINPVSLDVARERASFMGAKNVSFHLLNPDWAALPISVSVC